MLIYFDESYDNDHQYLILGALFNPHPMLETWNKYSKNFVEEYFPKYNIWY